MIKKLLEFFKSSKKISQLNQERNILLEIIEQKDTKLQEFQSEILLILGSILTAYNGNVIIDKKFIDLYLNGKFEPRINIDSDGNIELWLEQTKESNE